jgi:uncharacterized coiled-coil DUF342 family protein
MNRLESLERAVKSISERIQALESDRTELQMKLAQHERIVADLRLQQVLSPDRDAELEKEIAKLSKPIDKIEKDIKGINERLLALKEARARQLEPYRQDAVEYVRDRIDRNHREASAIIHDARMLRAQYIAYFKRIGELRYAEREMVSQFVNLSSMIDGKYRYEDFREPYPAFKGLTDTYEGNHVPVVPLYNELYEAYENGITPNWFNEYELSGEFVSDAEINNRNTRRQGLVK